MREYRMSGSGDCQRALSAKAMEMEAMPEPEFLTRTAREGKRHEAWVIEDLEDEGWTITRQQEEIRLKFPAFHMTGHFEGIATNEHGEDHLLEIKSLGKWRTARFLSKGFGAFQGDDFFGYSCQITSYYEVLKLPILYVVKDRDSGKKEKLVFDSPPISFKTVYDRIMAVEVSVRKELLYDVQADMASFDCKWCKYRYLCELASVLEAAEGNVNVPSMQAIERAVLEYKHGLSLEAEGKECKDAVYGTLIAAAKIKGYFVAGGLGVKYVPESSATTYPTAKLKEHVSDDVLKEIAEVKKRRAYIRTEEL